MSETDKLLEQVYKKYIFIYHKCKQRGLNAMRLAKALNNLDMWCRRDRLVFTHNDLRKLFPEDSDVTFKAGLARLTATGVMKRVARGVYLYTLAGNQGSNLLERIAVTLRRGHYNYLSLESALSAYGIISQVPLAGITVMTTGRSGIFDIPFGRIEFIHTKRHGGQILDHTRDVGRPLRMATPEAAVRDLRRVGRLTRRN